MLARVEIFIGLAVVAVLCILAGYAVVTGIFLSINRVEVHRCVARASVIAAHEHKHVSDEFLTATCERLNE